MEGLIVIVEKVFNSKLTNSNSRAEKLGKMKGKNFHL